MSQPNPNAELAEFVAESKEAWLKDYGQSFKDVLEDEDGEYIMVEPDLMDEGESESGKFRQVRLPDFTQEL